MTQLSATPVPEDDYRIADPHEDDARGADTADARASSGQREIGAVDPDLQLGRAWTVPAGRVATRIRNILLDTGDDPATVAQGLDVEPNWAVGVLTGEITDVDIDHVQRLCESLHCTPFDLFGAKAGRSIVHIYGPELWPRYVEPLEPIGWDTEELDDIDGEDPESSGDFEDADAEPAGLDPEVP